MIKKIFSVALSLWVLSLASVVQAADSSQKNIRPLIYGGLAFGGDDLATFATKGGDDVDVTAGGLFSFGAGVRAYLPKNKSVIVDVTLGYKFDSVDADNGDEASMSRLVLNAIPYYVAGNHQFGLGLTMHLNTSYEDNFSAGFSALSSSRATADVDFGSDPGLVLDYGYSGNQQVATIGVKLTLITYTIDSVSISGLGTMSASDVNFEDVDGNSVEIYALYAF